MNNQRKTTTWKPPLALRKLRDGHRRFWRGLPRVRKLTRAQARRLAAAQHPFACIIACSDSRVAPELLFDCFLGDLFVIRLPGNVITREVIESVEFAVHRLHIPLIVVLGHTGCAAIEAAQKTTGARCEMLTQVCKHLQPAVAQARRQGLRGKQLRHGAIEQQVRLGVQKLQTEAPRSRMAVARGRLWIRGAVYDLESGALRWLGDSGA